METEAPVVAGGFLRRAAWIPSGTLALFGCTIFVGQHVTIREALAALDGASSRVEL